MKLYTIGFTKKTAQHFFTLLRDHHVQCLIDTRLHSNSQLSAFAKEDDLPYFLQNLADCTYQRMETLAPSDSLLKAYRQNHDWQCYTQGYLALMQQRNIPMTLDRAFFQETSCCFLCSEATPEQCHRRLLADLLAAAWQDVEIIHLV